MVDIGSKSFTTLCSHFLFCRLPSSSTIVLLKRYDTVRLVEADPDWSRRSQVYLGRKRSKGCTFVCSRLEDIQPQTIVAWGEPADVVWLQWTLQYLTDEDAIRTLKSLASTLVIGTGVLIVKENRPFAPARLDRFQMDTPSGPNGRYDLTRTDMHHRLLFQKAGLIVDLNEMGLETNTYALVNS